MKKLHFSIFIICLLFVHLLIILVTAQENTGKALPPVSEQTRMCIECHTHYSPGIVEDWMNSRHSKTSPEEAKKKPEQERRVSAQSFPAGFGNVAIGCYECHSLNPGSHKDNIEHAGMSINVIVSPNDCKTCHPVEVNQYQVSKKAYALDNLRKNPTYHNLAQNIIGLKEIKDDRYFRYSPSKTTEQETCYACHGTEVTVEWIKEIQTDLGNMKVPVFGNWPNQGVGRINPDNSRGSCSSCHPRHSFSIEVARKPHTCSQCHVEPDTPAWNVYKESKHGNIYSSKEHGWKWDSVPWRLGKDFNAPTCSACHNSLIITSEGKTIANRTHNFGDRLWVRLFGLIYSHPQPQKGNTHIITNSDGQNMPVTFGGKIATEYLIDEKEQISRQTKMENICKSCHGITWVEAHFNKMKNTIAEADKMVLTATQIMDKSWNEGLANKNNPFDESIEHKWMKQWLFYANSVRYASAMGGPDYASFKNGWWELTRNLQDMQSLISAKINSRELPPNFVETVISLRKGTDESMEEQGFGGVNLSILPEGDRLYLGLKNDVKYILRNAQAELIILEFLNVHCPGCQMQVPIFNQLYSAIESNPDLKSEVKMLGIAVGNNQNEVSYFKTVRGVPYPIIPDPGFSIYDRLAKSMRTPYTLMLKKDKDGKYISVASHLGLIRSYESYLTEIKAVMQYDSDTIELKKKESRIIASSSGSKLSEDELILKIKDIMAKISGDEDIPVSPKIMPKFTDSKLFEGVNSKGMRYYAVAVGREPVCDICHNIQFIYAFDEKGNILGFEPVYLTKYGNKTWNEADGERMRQRVIGRSMLQPVDFDPDVDAVTSATITSAVIFKVLSEGREIFQSVTK